ncbi:MAG: hypothetical protein KGJ98_11935 [Chloroflexota bacterium]|nr:hypothetical protein [Chloroflexota bacterium]MDE3102932.1 hypothetical protein [Chloroflexota bacterium]
MNRIRALAGIVVFAAGVIAGVFASQLANPSPPPSPWASLPPVEEPAASAEVASLIAHDDAQGLAKALDSQLLQKLAQAIQPLVSIDSVEFTGATEKQGDILAGYVAGGTDQSGNNVIVGVVLRVRDGKVIGVN